MKKIVLIDANALVHRAFHALPPTLNSPQGVPTNAIFGFTSVLIKMLKDLKPDYVAATFDLAGPTFRHEEFAEYKSHRVKAPDELYLQIPYIKEILTAFGIPIFEKEGFEADDLIGSLAEQTKALDDLQVVIMTGDLDTLQLVEKEKVVVFTLRKGVTDTFIYNEKEVKTRYDLKPSQLIDFKGLKGDPSDNIPGVPGIGDKTASALVKAFGSLEGLYEEISKSEFLTRLPDGQVSKKSSKEKAKKPKPPLTEKLIQKLLENKDQAFFSKRLATIIRDVDFEFEFEKTEWRNHLNRPVLEKTLKDLALFSLVKRLGELDSPDAEPLNPPGLFDREDTGIKSMLLGSDAELAQALTRMESRNELVIDVQQGLVIFGYDGVESFGFPETALDGDDVSRRFKAILENPSIKKIGHDTKAVARWGLELGISVAGFSFDTKLAAFLLNSDIKDYALERLYFLECEKDIDPEPLKRTAYISLLKAKYEKKLKDLELNRVFDEIEVPLSSILARMEKVGIKVDPSALKTLSATVNKELSELERQISDMAGGAFNINSPQQLSVVLFEKLGLKGKVKKTGKGARSTAAGELEKLLEEHPIVALIMKYREFQKLKTTYIEPFPELIGPDGRVHTSYNQAGATTGRLSSEDPNLQNIPIRTEVGREFRKAFVAESGYKLVSFDYSQLELRIAAHISGDQTMIDAFKRGEDIHTRTAAEIFRVEPKQVTTQMRRQAKVLNFGLIYGMGTLGFQRAAGVNRETARQFIDNYMAEFSGVAKYMEQTKKEAHRDGFVSTIFGRRRRLPEINSGMPQLIASAERMAINHPIQGTEADLLKLAMIAVQKKLDEKYGDKVRMLLQVHDELLFEMKEDIVPEATKGIRQIMESVHAFNVPIVVDAKFGDNWSEMEEIDG